MNTNKICDTCQKYTPETANSGTCPELGTVLRDDYCDGYVEKDLE